MVLWLALACAVVPYGRGAPVRVAPVSAPVAVATTPSGEIVAAIDALLAQADDVDRRDRLVELRDLALAVETLDPALRGRVLGYLERVLAIEERAAAVSVVEPIAAPGDPGGEPLIVEESITEEQLGEGPGGEETPPKP